MPWNPPECDFCRKPGRLLNDHEGAPSLARLLAGPGICICEEGVDLFVEML